MLCRFWVRCGFPEVPSCWSFVWVFGIGSLQEVVLRCFLGFMFWFNCKIRFRACLKMLALDGFVNLGLLGGSG